MDLMRIWGYITENASVLFSLQIFYKIFRSILADVGDMLLKFKYKDKESWVSLFDQKV